MTYQMFQYERYYTLFLNACAVSVLRKLGPGVTYVTNATSGQIKAGTALAHACEVCLLPNLERAHIDVMRI